MKDVVFREYDIRGTVGESLILSEVYALGQAIAYYFKQEDPQLKTVVVGMDGRVHSLPIKDDLCRAFVDSGIEVLFVGVCPTPALYFALHVKDVQAGVMVTASHNPKEDNGIKLNLGTHALYGDKIRAIRDLYKQNKKITSNTKGLIREYVIVPEYVESLVKEFFVLKDMQISFVVDCGNGVAGTVIPLLVEKMGWNQVKQLHTVVDGSFPNHQANPVVIKNMQDVKCCLETSQAQFGVGFDGDADRMAAMTKEGELLPGDRLLAIFAQPLLQRYPGAAIVFNVVTSNGLIELLDQLGAISCMAPVGHSLIEDAMNTNKALLGGEISGHFFFKDRHFGYDDAIYAMMRPLEIMHQSGESLSELAAAFPKKISSPEYRIRCKEELKDVVIEHVTKYFRDNPACFCITIDGVRAQFSYGWILIRKSNTESVLSVRCESDTKEQLDSLLQEVAVLLHEYIESHELNVLRRVV